MLKIIIAEDNDLIRGFIQNDIQNNRKKEYEIVGLAKTGLELINLWKVHKPDVIITDLVMPELSGHKAILKIRETDKDVMIIVLTQVDAIGEIELLYDHIQSYLIKQIETPDKLLKKIDEIAKFKEPSFNKYILDILKNEHGKHAMTYKEYEFFCFIRDGLTNAQIAKERFLSEKAIEKQLKKYYNNYGVKNKIELIKVLTEYKIL